MKILVLFAFVTLFGLSSASLQDDLRDIITLVPVEEIRAIARGYIGNDPEVQEVLVYLQGPEWANIVETVRTNLSWQNLKDYLLDAGIDIEDIVQAINDIIAGAGNNAIAFPSHPSIPSVQSVSHFVDDILAIVPTDELLTVLNDRLENSADFQQFFAIISSEEARALVADASAIPEVKRIADALRAMGVDVDKTIEFVMNLLGWN